MQRIFKCIFRTGPIMKSFKQNICAVFSPRSIRIWSNHPTYPIGISIGKQNVFRIFYFQRKTFNTMRILFFKLQSIKFPIRYIVHNNLIANMMFNRQHICSSFRTRIRHIHTCTRVGMGDPYILKYSTSSFGDPKTPIL